MKLLSERVKFLLLGLFVLLLIYNVVGYLDEEIISPPSFDMESMSTLQIVVGGPSLIGWIIWTALIIITGFVFMRFLFKEIDIKTKLILLVVIGVIYSLIMSAYFTTEPPFTGVPLELVLTSVPFSFFRQIIYVIPALLVGAGIEFAINEISGKTK